MSGEDTVCSNCGVNLVTGEKYEQKYGRAAGSEPPAESATRVSGLGLAIGFGLVILAGFMYQREVMQVFRAKPERSRKYVRRAEKVLFLVQQCRRADTAMERKEYRREAQDAGEDLIESLDVKDTDNTRNSDGKSGKSNDVSGAWNSFRYNLQMKVKYHLSRLPE